MSHATPTDERSFDLPAVGGNPSSERQGTTPGSFAKAGRIGTPYTFSSPDTPGMPPASSIARSEMAWLCALADTQQPAMLLRGGVRERPDKGKADAKGER